MRKILTIAATVVFALSLGSIADAKGKPCHGPDGKFIKCPVTVAGKAAQCRDIKTKKFAKCDAPNTEPVPGKSGAAKK